jgi:hypothetical protein
MANKVELFKSNDGKLFDTEKEADRHDLDSTFAERLMQLAPVISGEDAHRIAQARDNRQTAFASVFLKGIIQKEHSLRELLTWHSIELVKWEQKYQEKEEDQ